jgi:hypothetical protein
MIAAKLRKTFHRFHCPSKRSRALLDEEDGLPDPAMFNVTGFYNQVFSFTPTQLNGFDSYKVTLYEDFAESMRKRNHVPAIPHKNLLIYYR